MKTNLLTLLMLIAVYGTSAQTTVKHSRDLQIGSAIPELKATDIQGKMQNIHNYIHKNQYILLDFWASWCIPCRAEGRKVRDFYTAYHGNGFEVVAFSIDTQSESWERAIAGDQLKWVQLSDLKGLKSPVARRFHIESVPKNFLVDSKGLIVAVDIKAEQLQEYLKTHLKQRSGSK